MPDTYTCSLCGWPCNSSYNLVQHLTIHANHRRRRRQIHEMYEGVNQDPAWYGSIEPFEEGIQNSWAWSVPYGWSDPYGGPQAQDPQYASNQIQQENAFGIPTTTYTQHTERPNGTTTTVSTVSSSLGAAVVTTTQSTASPIATTAVSQASGTFTCSYNPERVYNNECAICLETFSGSAETKTTPCNHKFHKRCLLRFSATVFRRNTISFPCPSCGQAISHSWVDSPVD